MEARSNPTLKLICIYAKFFKELCTNKRKLKGNEVMQVGKNCSAILQKKIPPKLKDPGAFTISCKDNYTISCNMEID